MPLLFWRKKTVQQVAVPRPVYATKKVFGPIKVARVINAPKKGEPGRGRFWLRVIRDSLMGTALASGMAYNAVHGVKMTSDEVSNALKASQEARTAKLDVSPERIANRFSALKKMESFLRANQGRKQDFVRFAFLSMPGQMDSLIESFRVKNGRLPNESEKFTLALNNFRDAIRTGRVSGSTLDSWIKQFSKG